MFYLIKELTSMKLTSMLKRFVKKLKKHWNSAWIYFKGLYFEYVLTVQPILDSFWRSPTWVDEMLQLRKHYCFTFRGKSS